LNLRTTTEKDARDPDAPALRSVAGTGSGPDWLPMVRRPQVIVIGVVLAVLCWLVFEQQKTDGRILGMLQAMQNAATEQARVANDEEHRRLRAYVSLVPVLGGFPDGNAPYVGVTVRNNGATPAYAIAGELHTRLDKPPVSNTAVFAPAGKPGTVDASSRGDFAFKDRVVTLNIANLMSNSAAYNALMVRQTLDLYFWGSVHYRDTFGVDHVTTFCLYANAQQLLAGDVSYCTRGNSAT
jgi:hypothetical protein